MSKHPHAELMAQYAEDAMETPTPWDRWQVKYRNDARGWMDSEDVVIWSKSAEYRRKPLKEPVDLSVLIESGIDCEFWDDGSTLKWIGKLEQIFVGSTEPYCNEIDCYDYCRPRMNHIHAWQGGICPLPKGVIVKVWFRQRNDTDNTDIGPVSNYRWSNMNVYSDIIQFKVIGLEDNYCWPWELEK